MSFKEILQNIGKKSKERKEKFKEIDEEIRMHEIIEDRKKSSNERELENFMKKYREQQIKKKLEEFRKREKHEINFGANPLYVKNIVKDNKNLLKANLFKGKGNMFTNQKNIIKGNKKLFNNGKVLNKGRLNLCH